MSSSPTLQKSSPQQSSIETPFLEYFEGGVGEPVPSGEFTPETPFISEYLVGDEVISEERSAFRELLEELYDSEFNGVLEELVEEADAQVQLSGLSETPMGQMQAEAMLERWIAPLRAEAEALIDRMSEGLDREDPRLMRDAELEQFLDQFEPGETGQDPVFEDFLGKVFKKAKAAVKGAVSLAKKGIAAAAKFLPINVILGRLKSLIRPLLLRVLKIALDKLPPSLRPAARKLAQRFLGGVIAVREFESAGDAIPATAGGVGELQRDFDLELAGMMFTDGPEQESLVADALASAEESGESPLPGLDAAREQFVQRLSQLQEGEDPTPAIQQFVPAILPALRIGLRVVGRPKVVNFLANYLGRLIQPYVGPRLTPPLSKAIVDSGLKLMSLEVGEEGEDRPEVAAEAFAALVEDTVARVSELDEDELEDEQLLEEATHEAFHEAAAAVFPSSILAPESEYSETARPLGTWVAMPRDGKRRYRKYSRTFDVTLSPPTASIMRTYGGHSLATFLRDRHGRKGPVHARVHLYQAIPGTRLGRISRMERHVSGLGSARRGAWTQFHPLTRETAMLLTGEAGLGKDVPEAFLEEFSQPAIGQRFYFLELSEAGPSPLAITGKNAGSPRRMSEVTAVVDRRRREARFAIYLGEALAQTIAARLRRGEPMGASLAAMRRVYSEGIRTLLRSPGRGRLRVIREQPDVDELAGQGGGGAIEVADAWVRWVRRALAQELPRQREAFITATESPEDGVTILVRVAGSTLPGPMKWARGQSMRPPGPESFEVKIVPGYLRA